MINQGQAVVRGAIPKALRYFPCELPHSLEEIDADLDVPRTETMQMLQEVHS